MIARATLISQVALLIVTTAPVWAQDDFASRWRSRIVGDEKQFSDKQFSEKQFGKDALMVPNEAHANVQAVTPFDEKQFGKDASRHSHCLTLREARREHPGRYLSWRGEHCWFVAHRR